MLLHWQIFKTAASHDTWGHCFPWKWLVHIKCLFTCRNSRTCGTPQTVTDTQEFNPKVAGVLVPCFSSQGYYVIHRVPTKLQEHWVTHCCKREAIANKGCSYPACACAAGVKQCLTVCLCVCPPKNISSRVTKEFADVIVSEKQSA